MRLIFAWIATAILASLALCQSVEGQQVTRTRDKGFGSVPQLTLQIGFGGTVVLTGR